MVKVTVEVKVEVDDLHPRFNHKIQYLIDTIKVPQGTQILARQSSLVCVKASCKPGFLEWIQSTGDL